MYRPLTWTSLALAMAAQSLFAQDIQRLPAVRPAAAHPAYGVSVLDDEALDEANDNDATADFDKRLSALEKAWQKDAEAAAKKKKDAASKPTYKMNGRIHLDYWNFTDSSPGIGFFENPDDDPTDPMDPVDFGEDPEDRILFRRIRLEMSGDILDTMNYRIQLDFHAPDAGEMKDVYIGFSELPVLGKLLIGNQKRPLGLDHLNSSRYNIFIERPLVVEAFNEDARRIGVCSYNVSEDERYNFRLGFFALENMVRDGLITGDSAQFSGNARLASTPWYDETSGGRGYFHWAVSGMIARPDGNNFVGETNSNEARFRTRAELRSDSRWINTGRIAGAQYYEILGLESILNLGPLQVVSEYQNNWVQRDDVTVPGAPDLHFHGAYVYVAYMLTGEHMPIKRSAGVLDRIRPFEDFFLVRTRGGGCGGGWGAWQLALRYSYLDLSDGDIAGGVENNLTGGLVWYWNAFASLQFNAIYGDINSRDPTDHNGFTAGHFTALGTRFRIMF